MNTLAAMEFVHLVFAALWTGGVVFLTWGVLPAARSDSMTSNGVETIVGRLRVLSRASALVLFVSGGLLSGTYGSALMQTMEGYLVLGMIVLWLLLIGFVEMATKTVLDALETSNVPDAVGDATGHFRAAGLVALLVLIDAGLISAF